MEIKEILRVCDHTMLSPEATWEDIKTLCDDGITYEVASVCIPQCYVKRAREYVRNKLKICTVIGFPHGNQSTTTKIYEAMAAIQDGADEIDMVINIGMLKAKEYDYIEDEIRDLKKLCKHYILKVIVEASLLTEEEKIKMCEIITKAGADYIKTSTGFSTGGATFEDVMLFKEHIGKNVKIKASGGISTVEDAEKFIELGASRLGTSKIVKIAKSM